MRKPANGEEWYATPQRLGAGFDKPVFHLTRRKTGAVEDIKEGDTIWLISELKSPWGKLPPSLDAKIVVQKVCPYLDEWKKFIADPISSQWFPLTDCLDILRKLESETRMREKQVLIPHTKEAGQQIGIFLQSIRKLHSANELLKWAENIQKKPFHFISYRIKDGTQCAFEKTKQLTGANEVVFWDRWSLPRRLAERREKTSGKALNQRLLEILRKSNVVWGIESELYAKKGSYSEKECRIANELGVYHGIKCERKHKATK